MSTRSASTKSACFMYWFLRFVLSFFFPLGISFVFDESARVYRVSFDDVFPEKGPFRETRVTDFSRRLSRNTRRRRYMKRVRKMKEQRGEE